MHILFFVIDCYFIKFRMLVLIWWLFGGYKSCKIVVDVQFMWTPLWIKIGLNKQPFVEFANYRIMLCCFLSVQKFPSASKNWHHLLSVTQLYQPLVLTTALVFMMQWYPQFTAKNSGESDLQGWGKHNWNIVLSYLENTIHVHCNPCTMAFDTNIISHRAERNCGTN